MKTVYALLALLCVAPLYGQSLTLPKEVKGEPGAFISVPATTDCPTVKWIAIDSGLNLFPVALLKDSKTAVVTGAKGQYRLLAIAAKGDVPTDPVICVVIIGDAPTPVPPKPEPIPVPPTPKVVPLAVDGMAAFIVWESSDKLTEAQQAILTSTTIRDYLNAKCAVDPSNPSIKAYRLWDKDLVGDKIANEHQVWRDAMVRKRDSLPWIIVSNKTNGKAYEGPLPADVNKTLELLKQIGE